MALPQTAQDTTLASFVERAAAEHAELPALRYKPEGQTLIWTYTQVLTDADRIAARLQEDGIRKGDRIILWSASSPWWVVAFFGILRAGAIVVPLDLRSSPEFVERVVSQTLPRLAFVSRDTADKWTYPMPHYVLEDLRDTISHAGTPVLPPVTPEDIAEIVFTSGTTGTPKGVILTHGNIRTNFEACHQVFPSRPSYRILSILPLSHMFGQVAGLLLAMRGGASITYCARADPSLVFDALRENHITTVLVVPRVLQMFLDAIGREVAAQGKERSWERAQRVARYLPMRARRALFRNIHAQFGGSLRFFVVGGAPVEPELERRWEHLGVAVLQGYGSTETAPVIATSSLRDRRARSVGRAVPGVEVRLGPDHEILVCGPNVTPGYWQNPDATAAAIEDGWYHTGDLGEMDAGGRLYVRGRKKELIVLSNGQKVYPADVEDALRHEPGVLDAVVLELPTPQGPEVHAVLLLQGETDPAAVVRAANTHLAPHQFARGYTVWNDRDFPRTHTEKIRRHDVLRAVLSEREAPREKTASSSRS